MVNQDAIVHSWRTKPEMLAYGDEEHPLTVQLGGASPERLAQAAAICVTDAKLKKKASCSPMPR